MSRYLVFVPCDPAGVQVGTPVEIVGEVSLSEARPDHWARADATARAEWLSKHVAYRLLGRVSSDAKSRVLELGDQTLKHVAYSRTCEPVLIRDWPLASLSLSPAAREQARLEHSQLAGCISAILPNGSASPGVIVDVATAEDARWMRLRHWLRREAGPSSVSGGLFIGFLVTALHLAAPATLATAVWLSILAIAFVTALAGYLGMRVYRQGGRGD